MLVVKVIFIGIAGGAGALAHGAEGDFALHADFMQQAGDAAALGGVDAQAGALVGVEQVLILRQGVDFLLQQLRLHRGGYGVHIAGNLHHAGCGGIRVAQHHAAQPKVV